MIPEKRAKMRNNRCIILLIIAFIAHENLWSKTMTTVEGWNGRLITGILFLAAESERWILIGKGVGFWINSINILKMWARIAVRQGRCCWKWPSHPYLWIISCTFCNWFLDNSWYKHFLLLHTRGRAENTKTQREKGASLWPKNMKRLCPLAADSLALVNFWSGEKSGGWGSLADQVIFKADHPVKSFCLSLFCSEENPCLGNIPR